MKKLFTYILIVNLFFILLSCEEESSPNLPPVEERVSEAINGLRSELTAPENGWKLFYKPTGFSGTFYMTLDFDSEGEVRIMSDLMDNEGEFVDHTIPYRIDNALGLELIFETYGVFHYLFEQNQATFGAEFEWRYLGNQNGNLVFESISDNVDPTRIILIPAEPGDDDDFALELSENLAQFSGVTVPNAIIQNAPAQQLILNDRDLSVFWQLDPATRTIAVDFVAEGNSIEEVIEENNIRALSGLTGYSLSGNQLELSTPISLFFNGQQVTINTINFTDLNQNGFTPCPTDTDNGIAYDGEVFNTGDVSMVNSYFNSAGAPYLVPNVSSVSIPFIFDELDSSLAESGIIADLLPDASGFVLFNGVELNNEDIPIYSVGFIMENDDLYLREYEIVSKTTNLLRINLLDSYYFSYGEGTPEDIQSVMNITDEIFEGGDIYAFDFPQGGVFQLFNPCNNYEIFLVQ